MDAVDDGEAVFFGEGLVDVVEPMQKVTDKLRVHIGVAEPDGDNVKLSGGTSRILVGLRERLTALTSGSRNSSDVFSDEPFRCMVYPFWWIKLLS